MYPINTSFSSIYISGWWLGLNPSEKYEFVNWDDEIPNINGKIKFMFQTTNQLCFWDYLVVHPTY